MIFEDCEANCALTIMKRSMYGAKCFGGGGGGSSSSASTTDTYTAPVGVQSGSAPAFGASAGGNQSTNISITSGDVLVAEDAINSVTAETAHLADDYAGTAAAAINEAQQSTFSAQLTTSQIAADLAAITANAAPQTAAAAAELQNGTSPLAGANTGTGTQNIVTIAAIGAAILTAIVFLRSNGKSA